jgi:hypothetical protein
MADSPIRITIPLRGTLIVRFEGGQEVEVGEINYNADVDLEIKTTDLRNFTYTSNASLPAWGARIG